MNIPEDQIESVLRGAPRPPSPPGLRQRLVNELPPPRQPQGGTPALNRAAGWRRWWPVVASGSLACVCLAVVGIQQAELRRLQAQLEVPPDATAGPVESDTQNGSVRQASRPTPGVAEVPMTDGQAELTRLRATAAELNAELEALTTMRAENERLRAELVAQAGLTAEETETLTRARGKAQRIQCVNNLKQLGLAARVWATDNADILPPDLLSMTNEMSTPKVLFCPADDARQAAADWGSFSGANLSYQYLAASGSELEPQRVMFVCPIHHNVTLCDGSVQQLTPEQYATLVQRDGKLYLGEPPPASPANAQPVMDRRMMERYGLTPEMIERYGLQPGNAAPTPGMSPEMMERYGLQPAPLPPDAAPPEDTLNP